jgi:hypothetical protein
MFSYASASEGPESVRETLLRQVNSSAISGTIGCMHPPQQQAVLDPNSWTPRTPLLTHLSAQSPSSCTADRWNEFQSCISPKTKGTGCVLRHVAAGAAAAEQPQDSSRECMPAD